MNGKRQIFDCIMLIYGKLMIDRKKLEVHDIFNYYTLPIDQDEYNGGIQEAFKTVKEIYNKTKDSKVGFYDMERHVEYEEIQLLKKKPR